MSLLKKCEIHFCKLDPKHPNSKFNKLKPTWELQMRTTDPQQKKEWEEQSLKPKLIVGKEGSPNEGEPVLFEGKKQWRVNLQKKSITKEGGKASPVTVVNGKLEDVDPNTIGNGSIANIRIFQYEYPKETGGIGIASVLMGIQLTKHILYTPKARDDDFGEADTETVEEEAGDTTAQF